MFLGSCLIICTLGLWRFVAGTADLNIHQLQMVADHLSEDECGRLFAALHQDGFSLKETLIEDDRAGDVDSGSLCIKKLLIWDRTEGINKTCRFLTLRLEQIGRRDLSKRLARAVYNDEADFLEKSFLSDPFKENIPKDSVFLDTDDKKEKTPPPEKEDRWMTGWEIFCVVIGCLTLVAIVTAALYKLFGELIKRMFKQYAPDFLVQWADMVCGECVWFCKKNKRMFEAKVIGKTRGKADFKTVMEMNRNLNNYLHGENAPWIFPEL